MWAQIWYLSLHIHSISWCVIPGMWCDGDHPWRSSGVKVKRRQFLSSWIIGWPLAVYVSVTMTTTIGQCTHGYWYIIMLHVWVSGWSQHCFQTGIFPGDMYGDKARWSWVLKNLTQYHCKILISLNFVYVLQFAYNYCICRITARRGAPSTTPTWPNSGWRPLPTEEEREGGRRFGDVTHTTFIPGTATHSALSQCRHTNML